MNSDLNEAKPYRIVIHSRQPDAFELSRVFQEKLHLHPTDAMVWARRMPGVLGEAISEAEGQAVCTAITDMGGTASVVRNVDLPDFRHANKVHHAQWGQDGFQIIGMAGEPELLIPWSNLQMICVGELPIESNRHYPTGMWAGVSAGHHYQSPEVNLPVTPGLEMIINCSAGFPNLRIEHEHMNYEFLGSRRVESATANFKEFLQDLVKLAPTAMLTESTRSYLGHIEPEHYRFKSLEEFLRYATLNCLTARAKSSDSCVGNGIGSSESTATHKT